VVKVSAIPRLSAPVPSPQPSLPTTPDVNVNVIDLAAEDLAYDPSRNLLYASVPNSEGARGDNIVAIDPGSGTITTTYPTGLAPRLLALSGDDSQLYFTSGLVGNASLNGLSLTSESVRRIDLASGSVGSSFASLASTSDSSYTIFDLAVLQGQPQSVAVVHGLVQNMTLGDGETMLVGKGPQDVQVYDDAVQRPAELAPGSFNCARLQPGATASRLYCASASSFFRLAVDSSGVSPLDSAALPEGNGSFTGMLYSAGKVFTTTGLVIDPEAKQVIGSVPAQGPVAVDGGLVHWLDNGVSIYPGVATSTQATLALRSYDATTLQAVDTRLINVTATDVTRLVACGQGRLAFRASKQIYIVNPPAAAPQSPSITLVAPIYSTLPVVESGSWVSIYGENLANETTVANASFPTSLGSVSVSIDNKPAYLLYVSPTQINVQVPDDTTFGLVSVVVNTPNGSASSTVLLSEYDPALCLFDRTHVAGVIPTPDGTGAYGGGTYDLVGPVGQFSFHTRPVKAGEIVELYGVGFGPTNPVVPAGRTFTGAAQTELQVLFTIGGRPAQVLFSGMSEAGLNQVNLVVPTVGSGDQLVQATVNGNGVAPPAHVTVQ
jgi:uncharacterized protein (TIGR03437 family)